MVEQTNPTDFWRIRPPAAAATVEPDGVILAIDFPATGRPDAGFPDLVRRMGTGHTVWESLPPPMGTAAGLTGTDYLDRWRTGLRDAPPVTAVFGYCASSIFALTVAQVVAEAHTDHRTPPTMLFDPTAITPATVLEYGFAPAVAPFAEVLGPERIAAVRAEGRATLHGADDDGLVGLASALIDVYRRCAAAAFADLGLDADRADELVSWFGSYLDYLVAAGSLPVPRDRGPLTVLRSEDLPEAMELDGAQEFRFPVDHSALLADEHVARTVVDHLTATKGIR